MIRVVIVRSQTMPTLTEVRRAIRAAATPARATVNAWFFKTKKEEYGHGDVFVGVTVPQGRAIAQRYRDLPLKDVQKLLTSKIHEERIIALFILIGQFERGDDKVKRAVYEYYLSATKYSNNWDLVDSSALQIVGAYLEKRSREILYTLARSKSLWERRIAIIATFYFIRRDDFVDTLAIAKLLLQDQHDLIHKAVGWMLREVGKRSLETEKRFLDTHAHQMPRTALRYAIERFPKPLKK